ncbi:MAG: methylmalonyl-CoA carboxyltransferase [Epulopiscium sp.]|nr:methylmalonyl-CoA carboxyltransferase [Candidatus Epulonipiscium sp.]
MSILDKNSQLETRRKEIQLGGGEAAINKIKAANKLTPRERINRLLDANSFVELGAFVTHRNTEFNMLTKETPADGVVTGYGTIDGRLVYVYSQDPTVMGGSLGEMHAKKIARVYDDAMKMGAPIIGFLDSQGIRLQESIDALEGYGVIFQKQSLASGLIPQITVITGDCAGGAGSIPGLSDFTFMVSKNARLFLNSPNTFEANNVTFEQVASADVHTSKSGLAHFAYDTEEECIDMVGSLVSYLPSNNLDDAPSYGCEDDLNRVDEGLNAIVPDGSAGDINIEAIIQSIADMGQFLEIQKEFAPNVRLGFIRLNGSTIGLVANDSKYKEGKLDINAINKISRFVNFCDAFNISILTLTDVDGFISEVEGETSGILGANARMINAFAKATVPKVNVLLRKAYGSAYVSMNSKHIGADYVYAWPTASVGIMPADSAVNIMYGEEILKSKDQLALKEEKVNEFEEMQSSPYAVAARGYIDDIIEPATTRKHVIAAFEVLYSKSDFRPAKKHPTL